MIIDFNGDLIDAALARVDPFDRAFTLGDGIFESLRVQGGQPKYLLEHLARLREASRVTKIALPFTDAELSDRAARLVHATGQQDGALRLTVSRGAAARGVAAPADCTPTVTLVLHPLPPTRNDPVAVIIATVTRRNEFSPLSRVKATPYMDSILALDEAKSKSAQDAILLNTQGCIACAAYANVFAVIDGRAVTPPLADGPLPGVTRGQLLAALDGAERSLVPEVLVGASEIFLCNSFSVRAVSALDGRAIPAPGPVTGKALAIAG
ncbi:MAG: aminotransferase class IV [Rhodospirillaceae bacterium]